MLAFILLSLVATASSTCLENSCLVKEDCSSCGILTDSSSAHYIFSDAKYTCAGSSTTEIPNIRGRCKLDTQFFNSIEYDEMRATCKLSKTADCCEPHVGDKDKLRQCALKSCRIPTGCTLDGVCQYDMNDESNRGNVENCCDSDADCPPFPAPYFWNAKEVPPGERMCTRVTCRTDTRSCVYTRAQDCCAADTPDCDRSSISSAKCAIGSCVYDSDVAAALHMNPFLDDAHEATKTTHLMLSGDEATLLRTYRGSITPLRCESRIAADCECEKDSDCTLSSRCSRGVCDSTTKKCAVIPVKTPTDGGEGSCCTGNADGSPLTDEQLNEQCAIPSDPCLTPVSCSSTSTVFHAEKSSKTQSFLIPRGRPLLPLFECRYVRRTQTADCCAGKKDCVALAAVNSCVLRDCTDNQKCALNSGGYPFMNGRYKLPCCYTDADCYADGGKIAAQLTRDVAGSGNACVSLSCSGGNDSVPANRRHMCIPHVHPNCPQISESVVHATEAPSTETNAGGVDGAQYDNVVFDEIVPIVTLSSCKMPIAVKFNAHVTLGTNQVAHQFVPYPKRIILNVALDGMDDVSSKEWNSSFIIVSAFDHMLPTATFPKPDTLLIEDAAGWRKCTTYRKIYDTATSVTVERIREINVTFSMFINSTVIASFQAETQNMFSSCGTSSYVEIDWSDGSTTVKNIGIVDFAPHIARIECPNRIPRETVTGNLQRRATPTFAPSFAPTNFPTPAPTFNPTPAPTFPVGHASCASPTIHCDALPAQCGAAITGTCLNINTDPGKCVPPAFGFPNLSPLLPIPPGVLRSSGSISIYPVAPIVDTRSFCWAQSGQCKSASLADPPQSMSIPCTCDCACSFTDLAVTGVTYFSNCMTGPLYLATPTPPPFTYTNQPTKFPTPVPTDIPVTAAPTPAPFADSIPLQCGSAVSPCPIIGSFCVNRTSTCLAGFCTDGCGLENTDTCTVNADCASRTCCGCAVSGFGYAECGPLAPLISTLSPTLPPTPALPTFSPTKLPTKIPTAVPTKIPTPMPAFPTPSPTVLTNGARNAEIERCLGEPWAGAVPLTGLADPPYRDNVVDTKITVNRLVDACYGCADLFIGDECKSKCMHKGGTHFSIPFEVIVQNFDGARTIPEDEVVGDRDGMVVIVNATNCGTDQNNEAICTSIAPLVDSIQLSPSELQNLYEQSSMPKFSAHRVIDSTRAFVIFRAALLPKAEWMSPPTINFQIRVEGCGKVPLAQTTLAQCLTVEARLVTGKCNSLIYDWIHCRPNNNRYIAFGQNNQYVYDYRQCVDGYHVTHNVTQAAMSPYPACTQCPITAAPTMSAHLSAKLSAKHHRSSGVLSPHLAIYDPLNYTTSGIVVDIEESQKFRLDDSGVSSCANGTSTQGLQPDFADRFLCSVNQLPKTVNYGATDFVYRCSRSSHQVAVVRMSIVIHNVDAGLPSSAINGTLNVEIERTAFDDAWKAVCKDMFALYRFEYLTNTTSIFVNEVHRSKKKTDADIVYSNIPVGGYVRIYIYVMLCDNTTVSLYPTSLKITAHATGSNGQNISSYRKFDSYEFNNTDIASYSTFPCSELSLGGNDCEDATLNIPCAYKSSVRNDAGASTTQKAMLPIVLSLMCCSSCAFCCFAFVCIKMRKRKPRVATMTQPLPRGPV